jgi:hypothetical protein
MPPTMPTKPLDAAALGEVARSATLPKGWAAEDLPAVVAIEAGVAIVRHPLGERHPNVREVVARLRARGLHVIVAPWRQPSPEGD